MKNTGLYSYRGIKIQGRPAKGNPVKYKRITAP
jgi:hypothetical protein